jgi:nucleoside-diphosphate-sugar epimerase
VAELTIAITGPTGELGSSIVSALERSRRVGRVIGMARRPFDPESRGWRKTEYRQGDVTDSASLRALVAGADVVVHLAFAVTTAGLRTADVNIEGSRTVFDAACRARVARIVHASSVAAYGFHRDYPQLLSEDETARGSSELAYSEQKAEVERIFAEVLDRHPSTAGYVFRPAIVAGPRARVLLDQIPFLRIAERLPAAVRRTIKASQWLHPVLPDPGVRLQLVHEDDLAVAFARAAMGGGRPGVYNLAAPGAVTIGEIAAALGWRSVRVPAASLTATSEVVKRMPLTPASASWVHYLRRPPLVATDHARDELGWKPRHSARDALLEMVAAHSSAES